MATLRAAYAADSATLEKLERTNVYNDAFCIGHDGVFGTINGLRMGRVPGILVRSCHQRVSGDIINVLMQVDWTEINAGWGQTLLLLYTIARKLDYTFTQYDQCLGSERSSEDLTVLPSYRLIPMGSFSRIEKTTGDKATYELYGSGDLHIGRLLHNRRFDFAMVAFLDCLKHLIDHVKSIDPHVDFPHQCVASSTAAGFLLKNPLLRIVKDRIGEAPIKLQFSQEESWTRALRHVLLALKILLKWTTNGTNG